MMQKYIEIKEYNVSDDEQGIFDIGINNERNERIGERRK